MWKILKLFILSILGILILPLTVIWSVLALERSHYFDVKEIKINVINSGQLDVEYLKPKIKALQEKLKKYDSRSLLRISLDDLSMEIQNTEWTKSHELYRKFPNELSIVLEAEVIPIVYLGKNGQVHPITNEGKILSALEPKSIPDVVIVTGENMETDLNLRRKTIQAVHDFPKEGVFSQKTISELHYDSKNGFWATLIHSKYLVKLGDDQLSLKAARISQVAEYLEKNPPKDGFETRVIDANLSKKVLVRLRKAP